MERTIGFEFEFCAIQLENGQACTRDQIKAIWREWAEMDHVELYFDKGTKQPVGVMYTMSDGRSFAINTDAGVCLVEFSMLPFTTLKACKENLDAVVKEFLDIAHTHGVGLMSHGVQPKTPWYYPDLKTEKTWYRSFGLMPYFRNWHGHFHTIAAHQACVGITYDELVPVTNALNAIGGVTIALFANASVFEYNVGEYHEEREFRWARTAEGYGEQITKIQGIPKQPFTSFKEYLTYNWSILLPSFFRKDGLHNFLSELKYIGDFLRGGTQKAFNLTTAEPSEVTPDITDVNMLNMYIWIQARPKLYFKESVTLDQVLDAYDTDTVDELAHENISNLYCESRNISAQPWEDIVAAPAYCLGLTENIEKLNKFVATKQWDEWIALREKTIVSSLQVDEVIPLAERVLDIAKEGLEKRGLGEEVYLEPLYERLEKRESPSMKAIKDFKEKGIDQFIQDRIISL